MKVTDEALKKVVESYKKGLKQIEIKELCGLSEGTVCNILSAYKACIKNDSEVWNKRIDIVRYVPRLCVIYNMTEPLHHVITVQDMLDEIDKAYPKEEPKKSKTLIGWLKGLLK